MSATFAVGDRVIARPRPRDLLADYGVVVKVTPTGRLTVEWRGTIDFAGQRRPYRLGFTWRSHRTERRLQPDTYP